jgi:type II secretory pathway component PulF
MKDVVPLLILSLAWLGVLWFWIALIMRSSRSIVRRRSLEVLGYVEQGIRLNAPLPEFLEAAAKGESGRIEARLIELRDLLAGGVEPPAAISAVAPMLDETSIDLIGSAWRNGTLAQTLRRIIEDDRASLKDESNMGLYLRWYPIVLLLVICGVISILNLVVVPKFLDLMRDYGASLPRSTRWIRQGAGYVAPLSAAIFGLWLISLVARHVIGAFGKSPEPARAWWDALLWRIPLLGTAARGKALADATGVMADALAAGRPIDAALAEAQGIRGNLILRRRIGQWAGLVASGLPLDRAAREARLPDLVSGTLAMAKLSSGEEEALRFLERYYRGVFSRSVILLRAIATPLVVIATGAMVTLIALAIFEPMIAMLNALSPYRGAN